jgi:hypothetical protein
MTPHTSEWTVVVGRLVSNPTPMKIRSRIRWRSSTYPPKSAHREPPDMPRSLLEPWWLQISRSLGSLPAGLHEPQQHNVLGNASLLFPA